MEELILRLIDKDDKKAYELSKLIIVKSAESNEYYKYFNDFISLLEYKSSYIRTRGFCLCCSQARWDCSDLIKESLPKMFMLLHDDKPTVVRQCLAALHEVALFKHELSNNIIDEIKKIDLTNYKDSMASLIHKDIISLLNVLE